MSVTAIDSAIRHQRLVFHGLVRELEGAVMQAEAVPLRTPLHQILVALYKLIDLLTMGRELLNEHPDVRTLGDLTREELPGAVMMLSEFAACYERILKVDRAILMGDRM